MSFATLQWNKKPSEVWQPCKTLLKVRSSLRVYRGVQCFCVTSKKGLKMTSKNWASIADACARNEKHLRITSFKRFCSGSVITLIKERSPRLIEYSSIMALRGLMIREEATEACAKTWDAPCFLIFLLDQISASVLITWAKFSEKKTSQPNQVDIHQSKLLKLKLKEPRKRTKKMEEDWCSKKTF